MGLYFLAGCSTIKNLLPEDVVVEKWEVLPLENYTLKRSGENNFSLFYNKEPVLEFIIGHEFRVYKKFKKSYVSLYCRKYQYYQNSKECELVQFSKTKYKYVKETGRKKYIGRAENRTSQFNFIGTKIYMLDGWDRQKIEKSLFQHIKYLEEYEKLNTVLGFHEFIDKYTKEKFDPDNLIIIAKKKVSELKNSPAEIALRQEEARKQNELRKKQEMKKKRRLEKFAQAKNNTEIFRQNIEVGSRSNCGLVVSVKNNIAEIQTSEGLMWLAISEIYPSYLNRCKIINGVYVHNALKLSSFN